MSSTHVSILADRNNTVVWMVSILLISKSSNPFANPLLTIPSAPISIGITVIFPVDHLSHLVVLGLILFFILTYGIRLLYDNHNFIYFFLLHIDLWQSLQLGISGIGCSTSVNRKTACVCWQPENKRCKGVSRSCEIPNQKEA